jgi:hypothetical protein
VKVKARISSFMRPSEMSQAILLVTTVVLPVPAPAIIRATAFVVTAATCSVQLFERSRIP